MHLTNILSGAGVWTTAGQVAVTFLTWTILYIARRTTGSLFLAIAAHGLWDFASFTTTHAERFPMATCTFVVHLLFGIAALFCVRYAIRDACEG